MQQSISIAPRFALGAEAETRLNLNTRCLVRSKIAIDAGLLLAFAIYVWTYLNAGRRDLHCTFGDETSWRVVRRQHAVDVPVSK